MSDRKLTLEQVAADWQVSTDTVRRWCESGQLKAHKAPGRGKRWIWRVKKVDADAFEAATLNAKPETPGQGRARRVRRLTRPAGAPNYFGHIPLEPKR